MPSYPQSYLIHRNEGEYQTRSTYQNKMKILSRGAQAFDIRLFIHALLRNDMHLVKKYKKVLVNKFKTIIFSFIRPMENLVFAILDSNGIKLPTRLKLIFSHLNQHKFRHGFRDTADPMCK